jgi:hypothetical protein
MLIIGGCMNWYKDEIEHHRKVVEAFKAITDPDTIKAVREANEQIRNRRCDKCGLQFNNNGYDECNCK